MSIALFRKTARDHRLVFAIFAASVAVFPVIAMHAFSTIPLNLIEQFVGEVPWIGRLIRALTGADLSEVFNVNSLGAFLFVHPVMLSLTWAYVVMTTSRITAGEIGQGTADLLLALPLSRRRIFVSVSAWVLLTCPALCACAWFGIWIGSRTAELPEQMNLWELRYVVANACAMLWAVAGISSLFSATASRRGRTVGIVFGILVASFLLNWLAAFWPRIEWIAVVGILHYFQPFAIIRDKGFAITDIAVLLTIAVVTWTLGGIIFARRDIHTS